MCVLAAVAAAFFCEHVFNVLDVSYCLLVCLFWGCFVFVLLFFRFLTLLGVFGGFWGVSGPIFSLFRVFYVDCARFRPKRPPGARF